MAKKKAGTIGISQLKAAVERAVKAEKVKDLGIEPEFHVRPGIIIGRQIRENVSLAEATAAAEAITKSVSSAARVAGLPGLEPAVLIINKRITLGFIDPNSRPYVINR